MTDVTQSSVKTTWQTPESFLDLVRQVNPIAYDPASSADNCTGATQWSYQTADHTGWTTSPEGEETPDCGLSVHWDDKGGMTFCNPPYGRHLGGPVAPTKELRKKDGTLVGVGAGWAEKMAQFQGEAIYLTPSRTDSRWWRRLASSSTWVLFWAGRLKFKGAKHPAPFPSCVFYRGDNWARFLQVFGSYGELMPSQAMTEELLEAAGR